MDKERIQSMIVDGLPGAEVIVHGDDGQHFEAEVTWAGFSGLSAVQQHRRVYAALGDAMGTEIHALRLQTRAP